MTTYDASRREYFKNYMRKRRDSDPTIGCGRRIGFSPADMAEIKRLYIQDHKGTDTIAERFGCAGATISYWLHKMGVRLRPANGARRFVLPKPTPESKQRSAMRGFVSQATSAAAQYWQPSIISFLPDSPRLEMEWRHVLAAVQAERGTQWNEINWRQARDQ